MKRTRESDSGQVFVNYLMHINEVFHVIIDRKDGTVHPTLQHSVSERFKTRTEQ